MKKIPAVNSVIFLAKYCIFMQVTPTEPINPHTVFKMRSCSFADQLFTRGVHIASYI